MSRTLIVGVGITKFEKPGAKAGDYPDWAERRGRRHSPTPTSSTRPSAIRKSCHS
jgi:hypothetical protein